MSPLVHRFGFALALALVGCGGGGGGSGGSSDGPPPPASTSQIVVSAASLEDLEDLCARKGSRVIGPVEGTSYYLVEVPAGVSAKDFSDDLDDEIEVEDADEDEGAGAPEGEGSTVPLFFGDEPTAIATQPALTSIGAPVAWTRGHRGLGVVVAVIDTGIFASSPSLAGRIAPGGRDFIDGDDDPSDTPNGLDDDADGLVDEGVGHGTFVASLILAVAPDAMILPIRALNSDAVGTASTVAQAIGYAVSRGADVINLSAGLRRQLFVIDQAVENAKAADVYVIASAGNRNLPQIDFPADVSEVRGVAALDLTGRKAPFSSYSSAVDLSAPGIDLIGAHPAGANGTARWSGTSFSTALVTGCFALLRGSDAVSPSKDLLERLEDTAAGVNGANPLYQGKLGQGRVDVAAATAP